MISSRSVVVTFFIDNISIYIKMFQDKEDETERVADDDNEDDIDDDNEDDIDLIVQSCKIKVHLTTHNSMFLLLIITSHLFSSQIYLYINLSLFQLP